MDADMILQDDIVELFNLADSRYAVQVVDGLRFERPSMMLFNNDKCKTLTPEWIDDEANKPHMLEWGEVGFLPGEWNHCVGYQEKKEAKLIHYTQGIPFWPETKNCDYSEEWWEEMNVALSTVSWNELMGKSVHAPLVKK
jgi:hypothetical protein